MDVRHVNGGTPDMETSRQALHALVCSASDSAGCTWLDAAVAAAGAAGDPEETLLRLFPDACRRLGAGRLTTPGRQIGTADGPVCLGAWSPGDAGRIILLLDAVRRGGGCELVTAVYRAGDESERTSIIRALSLFGGAAALKPLALQAGRTNSSTLYAALALDNPFAAAHYSEQEFNQMVLKSLFIGLPLEHIVGLARRANENLSRMCEDYFDERTAAGRTVPADIWLALAPRASERGLRLLREHLEHENAAHRHFATQALENRHTGS